MTQEALAALYGGTKRGLQDNEAGKNVPNSRLVAALVERGINANWLLADRGPPLLDDLAGAPQFHVEEPRVGYVYLPLYEERVGAAPGGRIVGNEQVVDVIAFKEDYLRQELHVRPRDIQVLIVEGDSMEPDIRPGDIVLVNITDTSARREGVYVLRLDDALLVKIVQRLPGGLLKFISRNEAYEPFTFQAADIAAGKSSLSIVGRVVIACRRF